MLTVWIVAPLVGCGPPGVPTATSALPIQSDVARRTPSNAPQLESNPSLIRSQSSPSSGTLVRETRSTPALVARPVLASIVTRIAIATSAPTRDRRPARILRVVDGDTVHLAIDGRDETVRLIGSQYARDGRPSTTSAGWLEGYISFDGERGGACVVRDSCCTHSLMD